MNTPDRLNYSKSSKKIVEKIDAVSKQIKDMIFKEKSILFPMSLETLTEDEWISIYQGSNDIGFTIVPPEKEWE